MLCKMGLFVWYIFFPLNIVTKCQSIRQGWQGKPIRLMEWATLKIPKT